MRTVIAGTGSYLPDRVLTNDDLTRMVDTTDEWIFERTGIRERRLAGPAEAVSDMAAAAGRNACRAAGTEPRELDLIITCTLTPDHWVPPAATLVQRNLGAVRAAAFDLNAACSGFIYGLTVGDKMVRTGAARKVLVVGAEVLSRITDWTDRSTCVLFGDGAGAALLVPGDEGDGGRGILSTHIHSDGRLAELLIMPGGGSRMPVTHEVLERRLNTVKMKGNETFRVAVTKLAELVDEVLAANGLSAGDIDFLVPHQANYRIIEATRRKLGLPEEKVILTVDRHGNTSAASVALALDEAVRGGRIKKGDLVLLEAFGGGLTWGAVLVRW
jgi:3-oxoacyl-[acyl-carrier-protein] synthase-3